MKQLVVISGKGGTGKTTLTSSLAYLSKNRNIADCDVEAPNLNLIVNNTLIDKKPYIGGKLPQIDQTKCIKCNKCKEVCRFDAIKLNEGKYMVDDLKCEGCGACSYICPSGAINSFDDETGNVFTGKIDNGQFSYAELNIGADGAGKLVTEVRKAIAERTEDDNLLIIDGSPGVGCVVIASITGCDVAVLVTEPTQSGLEDLKRVLSLIEFFNIKGYVVINKYDINEEKTKEIEEYSNSNGFDVVGKIPFDSYINKAMKENKLVVEYEDSKAGNAIKDIWDILERKI